MFVFRCTTNYLRCFDCLTTNQAVGSSNLSAAPSENSNSVAHGATVGLGNIAGVAIAIDWFRLALRWHGFSRSGSTLIRWRPPATRPGRLRNRPQSRFGLEVPVTLASASADPEATRRTSRLRYSEYDATRSRRPCHRNACGIAPGVCARCVRSPARPVRPVRVRRRRLLAGLGYTLGRCRPRTRFNSPIL